MLTSSNEGADKQPSFLLQSRDESAVTQLEEEAVRQACRTVQVPSHPFKFWLPPGHAVRQRGLVLFAILCT